MRYYDDDERDRPSWKEIDRRKDRSSHLPKEDREKFQRPRKTSYAHKQYKKKLEEFFSLGKEREEKKKSDELKKIMEIKNKTAYMKAADEYVDKNGYPRDLDFLLSLLDHKEAEKVIESLKIIEELFKDATETRKDIIKQKVHILEMTASDPKIQGLAEEILERINSS